MAEEHEEPRDLVFGDRRRRPCLAFPLRYSCLLHRHLALRLLFHPTGQLHPLAPMTCPIRPLQLQWPVAHLTSFLAPQTRHPDLREPLRPIHSDHFSGHIHLTRRHDPLPPNMYGPTHRPNLITACLLGPSPHLSLLLRLSALNNLPRLLLPPHLLQPSFLHLLCQPFFLLLL